MPSVLLNFIKASHLENRQSLPWNPNTVWDEIKVLGNKVSLYPDSYDVERVRRTLRLSKLLSATIMKKHKTLKWIFVLEGNQRVLFKPTLLDKKWENFTDGTCGCEHPEYEIVAFAINRLLGLRNMPFVTGRQINWFTDILPVADKNLLKSAVINAEGDVCLRHRCSCYPYPPLSYCFPRGNIVGSIMVWLDTPVLEMSPSKRRCSPWTLYNPKRRENFELYPPCNDTYCRYFRSTSDYYKDERFVNILDMAVLDYLMLSYDSKDNYIVNNKSESVNIIIDRGKSFFEDDLVLLAPIYQCCKIRKKVYESLLKLKDTFEEEFVKETQTDNLFPCLDKEEITAIKSRIDVILMFVKVCEIKFGLKRVLMDL